MLGGIEAGGTKFVCAVGPDPHSIVDQQSFATRAPAQTLADVVGFFQQAAQRFGALRALGVGSFGPLVLNPAEADYGALAGTPKPGWSGINLHRQLTEALLCPVAIDTDVNASGLAEASIGAGKGLACIAYITVGTGIGGGLIIDGTPLRGLSHPEMGHLRLRRHPLDTGFAGICPFHGDCIEGLASGAAIFARVGRNLSDVPAADPIWSVTADYLGQLCASLVLIASPQRIVLGGGVLASNPALLPPIRQATQHWLADYVSNPAVGPDITQFIVPPALDTRSGIIGALMMAERAAHG